MWYYIPEWLKWWKGKPKPSPQEEALSEIIKRKAEEQQAIIDRVRVAENPTPVIRNYLNAEPEPESKPSSPKVAEKDFFE
jgi:hypothetical protein